MVKWFVFRVLLLIVRFLIHSWQMSGVYIVFGYVAASSHQYNSFIYADNNQGYVAFYLSHLVTCIQYCQT